MKPMLAATIKDTGKLPFPLLVSPKLDGIRALVVDGVVVSRSLKPIPNKHVQSLFGCGKYNGLDGELVVGDITAEDVFQVTTSGVMSREGKPNVRFYVFDDFEVQGQTFHARIDRARHRLKKSPDASLVPHLEVTSVEQMLDLEDQFLHAGYEGLMARSPDGLYKHGRSTAREAGLLKLKRFVDSEAEIIAVAPLMHNTNKAEVNALGHKERSTKKAGKVAREMLGAMTVRDIKSGVEFDIGTGFTECQRVDLWNTKIIGRLVKYKSQTVGVKEKPRFPVFLGFRDREDMS